MADIDFDLDYYVEKGECEVEIWETKIVFTVTILLSMAHGKGFPDAILKKLALVFRLWGKPLVVRLTNGRITIDSDTKEQMFEITGQGIFSE